MIDRNLHGLGERAESDSSGDKGTTRGRTGCVRRGRGEEARRTKAETEEKTSKYDVSEVYVLSRGVCLRERGGLSKGRLLRSWGTRKARRGQAMQRSRPHLYPPLSFLLFSFLFAMNPNPQWNQGGYQQPQQTGYGGQPIYPQQTGYPQQQQQQQQRPPPPPLPQPSYSFLSAPPTQSQFAQGGMGLFPQATGWAGAGGLGGGGGGLQPQMTGWQGQGALSQQRTGFQGQQPLVPQPTGYHDPRVAMMSSSFMPQNLSSVSPSSPSLPFPPLLPSSARDGHADPISPSFSSSFSPR